MGVPSTYTDAMADRICELIATSHKGIARLCFENPDLPSESTIYRWLDEFDYFRKEYARAKKRQAHRLVDECFVIADDVENDILMYKVEKGINPDTGQKVFVTVSKPNHSVIASKHLRIELRKWQAARLAPDVYGDKAVAAEDKEYKITVKEEAPPKQFLDNQKAK